MNNIYLHAIYALSSRYNSKETLQKLKYILESNALLSKKMQEKDDAYGFNGLDYISICDYDKRNLLHPRLKDYNSYYLYIKASLSIMFPKDKLKVIIPEQVNFIGTENPEKMKKLGLSNKKRYSDLLDEVQVKDKVPLSLMSGITLPVSYMRKPLFSEKLTIDMVIDEIEKTRKLLNEYGYDVPFYDIKTFTPLNDKDKVRKLVKDNYNCCR